jgi:YtkA-like
MRGRRLLRIVIALTACAAACAGPGADKLTELQRVKSGQLDVVLLSSHDAIKHGKDSFVIEFRSADGALVDVGEVKASATMPMPGSPMFGSVDVKRTSVAGRYAADATFDMAGTWRTTIQWMGSPGSNSVTFSGNVQ